MEQPSQSYPLLSKIDSPADLRALDVEQLPQLCAEIRAFLVDNLSRNPGHFASSMGAVEITVALHYVFDTPRDRLVWDVGHQAYAHKLLTGRREAFATQRTLNGISGFPDPDESQYDTFTAGHASNSISAALGMAVASQLRHDDPMRHVVAVIGDASISGGLAFEGLNNAANTPNNLLIVLNDNDMSIDRNVGSLHRYLGHINTSKHYNSLRYKTYNFLKRHGVIGENGRGVILRFNNAMKSLLSGHQNIFDGLNIRYFGPYDGHDVVKLVRVFNDIKDIEGPRILHLRTVKGRGYAPAEADPANWHAPGHFDAQTGQRQTGAGKPKWQDVFGDALLELARADSRVVAITAAMPSGTSIATMQQTMPDRVFDVGISEGHAVTFAGGLAREGLRPVVGIYSSFLQRAYDHIIHDVAIQRLPVIFAIDRAGLVGEDGVTHHGTFDMSFLSAIPGMTVAAPSSAQMLRDLMHTAQSAVDGPIAIRYPRGTAVGTDGALTAMKALPVGKGRLVSGDEQTAQVAILSIGDMAQNAAEAAALLADRGITAVHYDMIFLKPIDTDILRQAAAGGRPILTVENGTVNGGLGSAVAKWLTTNGYSNRLAIAGIPDNFVKQGTVAQLQQLCGLDARALADKAVALVSDGTASADSNTAGSEARHDK